MSSPSLQDGQPQSQVSPSAGPASQGATAQHVGSRRPPAHRSVSLKHNVPHLNSAGGPSVQLPAPQQNLQQQYKSVPPQSTASSLINHKASSGESSNADNWFDRSNQNVVRGRSVGDNSPPFFVQNSSTDTSAQPGPSLSLPFRSAAPNLGSMGSSSEEYRSVIDDLTIQNKRLKRRLKGYERYRERNLETEAMFEVKMRGLTRDKKRELEQLLTDFARNANQKLAQATSGNVAQIPSNQVTKHSSSQTSTRVADSGYGSLSLSNQGSSNNPHKARENGRPFSGPEASRQRDRSIHSFLHDIPEGLLPKPPNVMTEKSKKRLVVERLEQIFGGRGASAEGHQQPLQQQKVSHSAAEDDREAIEARGDRAVEEGKREACIMENETEEPMDLCKDNQSPFGASRSNPDDANLMRVDERDFAASPSPAEQRPTRPLDLDPHRAQIPAENIEYLRHLGFTMTNGDVRQSLEDDQGWIYLNLMVNMAQLHTVNVTIDLVRHAVKDYSKRFELSADGRKVRWRGSPTSVNTTNSSSSGAEPSSHSPFEDSKTTAVGEKRPRPAHLNDGSSSQATTLKSKKLALQDKFQYTPVFKRQLDDSDDEDLSMADDASDSSPLPGDLTGESSALATSSRFTGSGSKRQEDGTLVFYKDQQFFTDLSCDRIKPTPSVHSAASQASSVTFLGRKRPKAKMNRSSLAGSAAVRPQPRYFSHDTKQPPYHSEGRQMPPASETDVKMENDAFSPRHVSFSEPRDSIEFKASGLFGICPRDNLAIHVVRGIASKSSSIPVRRTPSKLDEVLASQPRMGKACEKILSVRPQVLEPSLLPPPSFAYSPDDASVDDDDGSDSDGSEDSDNAALTLAAQQGSYAFTAQSADEGSDESEPNSQDSDYGDDDDEDDDDDGSLDFLATARAADPEAIYAREREYDAAMAERLADEIPAGSSAATAGGGSGFNSPVAMYNGRERKGTVNSQRDDDRRSVAS